MVKWNMYAAYMTLLVVNNIFISASHDIEVSLNDSVSIGCSPPVPMDIQWHHTGHMKSRKYVYAGRNFYSTYKGRFQLDNYSLLIPSVNSDDAGLYECSEEISGRQLNSVHLTVLESIPVCGSNMKSHGYVGPSTCNLEQEEMTFTCVVSYNGQPPQMIWTTLNDSQAFNESTCKTENGRINCILILKADPKYDGSIFTCQSTKSSVNCRTEIIKIQYFESDLKPLEKNISDQVNCSVKSNQILHFKWTQLQGVQYITLLKSQMLLIQSPGIYRCIVEYRIRNTNCSAFGSEVIVPNPSISRSETGQTSTMIAIAAIFLICHGIIATPLHLFYGFCLRKLKEIWQNVGWPWQLPHVRAINRNYDVLQRCTDNNFHVTGCLRGEEVLDLKQESQLKKERDLQTRVRLLYDWLKETQEDSKYQKFLQVMESDDVRQQHVAFLLRDNIQGNLGPLGESRYTRLVKIRPKFAVAFSSRRPNEDLEPLFSRLKNLKAISVTDYNEIAQQKDGLKRGYMLVDAIMRRSNEAFDMLRQTLTDMGFGVLADYLVKGDMPIIHANITRPDHEPELAQLLPNGVNHHPNGIDLGLPVVHASHGRSIEVYIYCRKLENIETFIEAFNSGKLENIFSFTLKQLLQEIEPENTDGLEVTISIDEEEVIMLEEASGIKDWIQDETKIRKPGLKSLSNFGVQCDPADFHMQIENLPLEMLDMILIKTVRRMILMNSSKAFKSFDELMYQVLNHLRTISHLWDSRLHATEWVKIQLRRLRDTGADYQSLKSHRNKLIEIMESQFGLPVELLKMRALSFDQCEEIRYSSTRRRKNEMILDFIMQNGKHQDLIKALSVSSQTHLVNYIRSNGVYRSEFGLDWPLKEREHEILNDNEGQLINILDTSELLPKLYNNQVINIKQRKFISSRTSGEARNKTLLRMIRRFSKRSYLTLTQCLRESHQTHIADILENDGGGGLLHLECLFATLESDNLDES